MLNLETALVHVTNDLPDDSLFPGSYARITVSDTGCGVDDEIRQRIFEPFFTTKEVGRGTGLGLSIVYGIIKQHGGAITMESELGKGTCFRIYLPLIGSRSLSPLSEPDTPVVGGTETILVAEDNDGVRHFLVKTLKDSGYQVIEAHNGQEALARYRANSSRIQLVLLDVVMPGMNGREVFETVKNEGGQVKALFLSGYAADIMEQKGILDEECAFLAKPVTAHVLLSKVREILDRLP